MKNEELRQAVGWRVLVVISMAFLLGGCPVKFVADYDEKTFEEVISTGKKVDRFYGDLLEIKESERQYAKFSQKYVEIETDLRSLQTRNQVRALNPESTKIAESILGFWVKYKDRHAKEDTYKTGTAEIERKRFQRLFVSAANAESAKKLEDADKKPE